MSEKSIGVRVIKSQLIEWKVMQFIQTDTFKVWANNGEEKLTNSLLKYQFVDPFKVWENDGVVYCLDGKHRFEDLISLSKTGIKIPNLLPAVFIDCADKIEAAELVLVYSSNYAKITADGMFAFIKDNNIPFEPLKDLIDLPGLDLDILNDRFIAEPTDFIGLSKNKPLTLTITLKNKEQIDSLELIVKEFTAKNEGSFYSVSAGEL